MMHVMKSALEASALKPLETKDVASLVPEIKEQFISFQRTFEEFKATNEDRLKGVQKKFDDVVTQEKLERVNTGLDSVKDQIKTLQDEIIKAKRPVMNSKGEEISAERKEHSEKFEAWFRKGEAKVKDHELADLEQKALAGVSSVDPSGGFSVRPEMDSAIEQTIKDVSPMRQICRVQNISSNAYQKLVNRHGVNSGWVGETGARPQTLAPDLSRVDIPTMEMYAMPAATQTLLDDAAINIDQWIADEVSLEFAQREGAAFINGTGGSQPLGIIGGYNIVADASYAWGSIGYIPSGAAGAFTASAPADAIISLMYALRASYRANSSFLAGRTTLGNIRRLKDGQNNYLVDLRLRDDFLVETIFGRPAVEAEDMPAIAANSHSLAFGDFQRAYTIVDRTGTRVLRDPYTAKPYVLFYTTKRVGGGVTNFEAVKLMRFAVS
jgi:HK97 family phage major capsid protein